MHFSFTLVFLICVSSAIKVESPNCVKSDGTPCIIDTDVGCPVLKTFPTVQQHQAGSCALTGFPGNLSCCSDTARLFFDIALDVNFFRRHFGKECCQLNAESLLCAVGCSPVSQLVVNRAGDSAVIYVELETALNLFASCRSTCDFFKLVSEFEPYVNMTSMTPLLNNTENLTATWQIVNRGVYIRGCFFRGSFFPLPSVSD